MRTITLEEHFATPGFFDTAGRELKNRAETVGGRYANLIERLCDIDAKRLAEMDAAGIDMQVLSLTSPGVEQLDAADAVALARDTNDYLADAVKKHPTRFAGLAAVPTSAPDKAAAELETRMRAGFKGAVINGHNRGRYLDDNFFTPILECAETLNVPIYVHPTPPPKPVLDIYYGGFAPMLTEMLAGGAWGWHIETAVHVIRMISGGVFDRFPQAAGRHRPHGRRAAVHVPALRYHAAGGDQAEAAHTRIICATTCTTPSRALISRRRFSICFSNSAASTA